MNFLAPRALQKLTFGSIPAPHKQKSHPLRVAFIFWWRRRLPISIYSHLIIKDIMIFYFDKYPHKYPLCFYFSITSKSSVSFVIKSLILAALEIITSCIILVPLFPIESQITFGVHQIKKIFVENHCL